MTIRIWKSYSCNNSSSYRLVAKFRDAETAASVADELQKFLVVHATEVDERGDYSEEPSNAQRELGTKYGFTWTDALHWGDDVLGGDEPDVFVDRPRRGCGRHDQLGWRGRLRPRARDHVRTPSPRGRVHEPAQLVSLVCGPPDHVTVRADLEAHVRSRSAQPVDVLSVRYGLDVSMHLDASDFAAMDDAQRLSVLETMIVGMIADNRITPAEARRFDEIVLVLPWGVDRAVLDALIKGAKERLLALRTQAEIQDYVEQLATRLPSPELREKIVFTMATLMLADGELAQIEKNVLGLFVLSFGITSDRAAAIREALHIMPTPVTAPPRVPETN